RTSPTAHALSAPGSAVSKSMATNVGFIPEILFHHGGTEDTEEDKKNVLILVFPPCPPCLRGEVSFICRPNSKPRGSSSAPRCGGSAAGPARTGPSVATAAASRPRGVPPPSGPPGACPA